MHPLGYAWQVRECMMIFLKSLSEGTMFNIIGSKKGGVCACSDVS